MKSIILFLFCFIGMAVHASDNVVNIYNWSGYVPQEVLIQFEKETGIRVNYSTFDDNQVLYAKLKADSNSDYDLVIPTSYIVQRMIKEKMVQRLEKAKLPNIKHLNPRLMNASYDPENQYSLPYLWGTTGILINKKYYSHSDIQGWLSFWSVQLQRKVALLNDMRDIFAMAMKVLGYSANDHHPQHIQEAYLKLKELLPNVQSFSGNGSQQFYINEDAKIGMINSGDANIIMQESSDFAYLYPEEGALIWVDCVVIPTRAKHREQAHQFINFILRPDVAKAISVGVGYSSPNLAAIQLMPSDIQNNRVLNPRDEDLRKAEVEGDLDSETTNLYLKYWERLKLEN